MTHEFEALVESICARPGLYVGGDRFDSVCAFLEGYSYAKGGEPLRGFREWLVVRQGGGENLVWWGLVLSEFEEDWITRKPSFSNEVHEALVAGLGHLLDEFFRERRERGLERILARHSRWLLSQDWYDGPLRQGEK